jgi:hypothetical protein
LNILFLLRISGLVVGIDIVTAGSILCSALWRSLARFSFVLLFLAVMLTIDFGVTRTNLYAVIHEYRLAAQGRVGVVSVIAMVCVPEALASARAVHINCLVSSATIETITISANKGVEFKIRRDSYDGPLPPYLNRAIKAIEELGESRETIVNLDNEKPFPALFLAPDPKGVWVWWGFKYRNVPVGYRPSWREIIGDACVVAEPTHSPTEPVKYYSEPLKEAVRTHLMSAFTIVYEDELWKIWKRSPGCSATGGQPD